jgi:hypothetical protein
MGNLLTILFLLLLVGLTIGIVSPFLFYSIIKKEIGKKYILLFFGIPLLILIGISTKYINYLFIYEAEIEEILTAMDDERFTKEWWESYMSTFDEDNVNEAIEILDQIEAQQEKIFDNLQKIKPPNLNFVISYHYNEVFPSTLAVIEARFRFIDDLRENLSKFE